MDGLLQPPRPTPVPSDAALPTRTAVVVIGGGIVGVSTALFLAEKGVPVVLCEKGAVAGEQSSRNWGWCRNTGRDIREVPLMAESARLWAGMNERAGADTGYRRNGIAYLCKDPAEAERMEGWLDRARPFQLGTRLLGAAETAALFPQSRRRWAGALFTEGDGQAEPHLAAPAIARAAQAKGARILTNCAVRGVDTKGGRVSGVITERGRIDCEAVVLAGGAWSSLFAGSLGLHLPQLKILASVMRTAPLPGGPVIAGGGDGFGYRKRADGGYTIANLGGEVVEPTPDLVRFAPDFAAAARESFVRLRVRAWRRTLAESRLPRRWAMDRPSPFEAARTLNPRPHGHGLRRAFRRLAADFPVFGGAQVTHRWAGLIDVTPDAIPVISAVDGMAGLFIGTGFSGHGFGIGPGAGKALAEMVVGDETCVDLAPFRFARFGERPRPRPSATAL